MAKDEPTRDERARDERVRDERARDERAHGERPRGERPRDERAHGERPHDPSPAAATPTSALAGAPRTGAFDRSALERLPTAESLASDRIVVDPNDPDWAPPAITNQWAGLVAGRDVFAYAGLSTPDLYAHSTHGRLYAGVDGGPIVDLAAQGDVAYQWFPSRIERHQDWRNLAFDVTTLLPPDGASVVNLLAVRNDGDRDVALDLFVTVTADTAAEWDVNWPPGDPVRAAVALHGERLWLADRGGGAVSIIATDQPLVGVAGFGSQPDAAERPSWTADVENPFAPGGPLVSAEEPAEPRWADALARGELDGAGMEAPRLVALQYRLHVPAGETSRLTWVHALATDAERARADVDAILARGPGLVHDVRDAWEAQWRAAFDRDAEAFSGYLPVLESSQPSVERLYYMGVMNLLYCKRSERWGEPALTYVTGFPSSIGTFAHTWVFPWDTMMVSGVLSQLDPAVMKRMITAWLEADMHTGCAIEFRTGRPVGFWYAVNDYALIHMTWQYLRTTGDLAFLRHEVRGEAVIDHLLGHARYYRRIAGDDGLADYGGAENLLECVSSYTHKVASFNAANVWNGETVAAMLRQVGRAAEADELEDTARRLADAVQTLYLPGEGFWACKQPDDSLVPVRHCLDFITVLQCMPDALSRRQVEEMVAFFLRELKTTTWMHALSPLDPDTAFSSRTDHQDEGAYTTWPAYSLEVLLQTGYEREALAWIGLDGEPGLADVTRQGPFGQAYTHGDEGSPRIAGAGAKAPMEFPHIEKPVLLPGGKYAQVVIEALAGVQPELGGDVRVEARDLPIDVRLTNLHLRGENHHLDLQWRSG